MFLCYSIFHGFGQQFYNLAVWFAYLTLLLRKTNLKTFKSWTVERNLEVRPLMVSTLSKYIFGMRLALFNPISIILTFIQNPINIYINLGEGFFCLFASFHHILCPQTSSCDIRKVLSVCCSFGWEEKMTSSMHQEYGSWCSRRDVQNCSQSVTIYKCYLSNTIFPRSPLLNAAMKWTAALK